LRFVLWAIIRVMTLGKRWKRFEQRAALWIGLYGPPFMAVLIMLMGVVNVLSALSPALHERLHVLERYVILEVRFGSRLAVTLAGFALLLLGRGLWRHKQVAWFLTLVLLLLSAASHLLKGLDIEEALLAMILALLMVVMRPHFRARSDPPSVRQGLRVLVWAFAFTLAYGTLGFYLLDRHFHVRFDLLSALRQTVVMFTQFTDPGLQPITRFGRYFADSIYAVAMATMGYGFLMLLRPVVIREPATPAERQRASAIVEAHGRTPLARFALFEDKAYVFTPGGSLIAFSLNGRVALALGDPIGPSEDARAAIVAFREHCLRNDWQPAFYQIRPDFLDHYRELGFDVLCIGEEAIVDLATFTLEGPAGKDFRNVRNRMVRLGHQAEFHAPPHSNAFIEELRLVSDEWLDTRGSGELRFSMGWFHEDYLQQTPVMVIRTPEGVISAFANLILVKQGHEVGVDLMRHRRRIQNGTMEFLFINLFEWARGNGYAAFNLGLSALSGSDQHSSDAAVEQALRYLYQSLSRFYNYKGLHAFKAKFNPRWEPRFLAYPGALSLPAVGLALVQAHVGRLQAFLPSWRPGGQKPKALLGEGAS